MTLGDRRVRDSGFKRIVDELTAKHLRTVYPSFYDAVHRAWDRAFPASESFMYACRGGSPYDADEHECYRLAGPLRVELHAAGIRLSIDGNGSSGGLASIEGDGSGESLPKAITGVAESMGFVHVFVPSDDEQELRQRIAQGEQPVMLWPDVGQIDGQIDAPDSFDGGFGYVGRTSSPPSLTLWQRFLRWAGWR